MQTHLSYQFFRSIQEKAGSGENFPAAQPVAACGKERKHGYLAGEAVSCQRDVVELGLPADNTQEDALSVSLREMAEGLESDDQ